MRKKAKTEISFIVDENADGGRLDRIFSQNSDAIELGLSRSQLKQMIEKGSVTVNTVTQTKSGLLVKVGDIVQCSLAAPDLSETSEYEFELKVCYEDSELIVIDKPAGLTVHSGANTAGKTLVNALIHYYKQNSKNKLPSVFKSLATSRGGVVHRLDKDTSGLLVVAKNLKSLQSLSKQFAQRTAKRRYEALVFSTPRGNRLVSNQDSGQIDLPIGRDPKRRVAMGIGGVGQRQAITEWQVIDRYSYGTLLELRLKTGRTHQIRVHMNAIGSPVIGDKVYGDFSGLPLSLQKASNDFGRQALHAKHLGFIHPKTSEQMDFSSEIPDDMNELIHKFSLKMTKNT